VIDNDKLQLVLSIDTSGEFAGITLLGQEPVELFLHSPDGHADKLIQNIDLLLRRAGKTIHDVDCFAAASGPGSFTGVRVALSAAKGLAEATGKPVVAVSNLQALAFHGTAPLRAPVIDARRGEIFGAVYDAQLNLVQPELVSRFQPWREQLPEGVEIVCAGDFLPVPFTKAPRSLATAVAIIARRVAKTDPAAIDANYVRRADAELNWIDRSTSS
jgi:tRNA threonylcarbamoyl adenosine modification protein YeaZ